MSTNIVSYVETGNAKKNFYPTPESIAEQLLQDVDLRKVQYVLEPSAGKGDLARMTAGIRWRMIHRYRHIKTGLWVNDYIPKSEYEWREAFNNISIDCIEIDPVLRAVLESNTFRVIHDDFLTFETQKRYDLIVMNPPFDAGVDHLLHAVDIMRYGGTIACIMNAESIRNPYSYKRQELLKVLDKYNANVRFVENGFSDAERKTDVVVALITFEIPAIELDSTIMEEMRKAPTYKSSRVTSDVADLVQYNAIEELVNCYNFEVACGIRLIEEYLAMSSMMKNGQSKHGKPLISLGVEGKCDELVDINKYIRATRSKYWESLFYQPVITEKFTSNLLDELRSSVREMADYEFSAYNILTLIIKMNKKTIVGIEETIIVLFDKWTRLDWHENSPNRHYYNGWKTNSAFRIGKKVIQDFYAWSWGDMDAWRIIEMLSDVEKTMDFLDAGHTDWPFKLNDIIKDAINNGQTRKIETKYFFATFYKKGTCHLEFKDMNLLEKFNLFASQRKGWLPPQYGKKHYSEMDDEEKAVIDDFQGQDKYEEVMARRDYYLSASTNQLLMGV